MLPTGIIIFYICIALLGGIVLGLTGFGFALLVTPFFFLFMPPATAVPIMNIITVILSILLSANTFRNIQCKRVSFLFLVGLLGLPFGITLLVLIPANILKVAAGLIIAVFVLLNYYGLKFRTSRDKTASTIAGVSGGL